LRVQRGKNAQSSVKVIRCSLPSIGARNGAAAGNYKAARCAAPHPSRPRTRGKRAECGNFAATFKVHLSATTLTEIEISNNQRTLTKIPLFPLRSIYPRKWLTP
jgi:hypothetical protein